MAGFTLTSGRKTNYVGKVVDASFTNPPKYEGIVLDLSLELEDGSTWSESYSIGKNWTIISPTEIVSIVGSTDIVASTMYGRFIHRVASLPKGSEILEQLASEGKSALDATAWIGFTFLFEEETIDFGKTLDKVTKNMPAEIIEYGASNSGRSVDEVIDTLRELAANSTSQPEFFAAAMAEPGVATNGSVVDQLGAIWNDRNGQNTAS